MKKFQSINNWLNEQKKEEPLFGCVMLDPMKIKGWEENHLNGIEEDDIYIHPTENFGLENNPHITLLFGIHEEEIDPSVVIDLIEQRFKPVVCKISEIDIFESKDYDVVKYNVPITEQIQEYRDKLIEIRQGKRDPNQRSYIEEWGYDNILSKKDEQ